MGACRGRGKSALRTLRVCEALQQLMKQGEETTEKEPKQKLTRARVRSEATLAFAQLHAEVWIRNLAVDGVGVWPEGVAAAPLCERRRWRVDFRRERPRGLVVWSRGC